jgi:diphosphate-dependent phosphofructokinase
VVKKHPPFFNLTLRIIIMSKPKKVAILTAGGLAPCLNSAIGSLIERYTEIDPSIEIICYRSGYKGLLYGHP